MKVTIISNYFLIREMTQTLLKEEIQNVDIEVIDIDTEINHCQLDNTELIILDIVNYKQKYIKVLKYLEEKNNKAKLIIYTDHSSINELLEFKAQAYVMNIHSRSEFKFILEKVMNGYKYYDSQLMESIIDKDDNDEYLEQLTSREKEILFQIGKGLTNKAISKELFVTEYTVKKHITSIFNKLNLKNRSEAIIYLQRIRAV